MTEPAELKTLVLDSQSGAREIAQRALALLQRAATQSRASHPWALLDELADAAVKVIRSKPEMPTVHRVLDRLLAACESHEDVAEDLGDLRLGVVRLAQDHLEALHASLERVAENAQALLANGDVVVTHSRSSTVLAALRRARGEGKLLDVVVGESRPLLEGRTLARELAADLVPVRFVVDALASSALDGADRVLLGADAVGRSSFVNKVGTRALVLAAREAGVPVVLLAETHKAWAHPVDPDLALLTGRHRDPKEVWDSPPAGVEVVNLYFESAPLSLVDRVVTEHGAVGPGAFWDRAAAHGGSRRLGDLWRET